MLKNPVYIGICSLEMSKVLMQEFHYNYMKIKYRNNPKLLFKDTDSLIQELKAEDAYKDFSSDIDMFDFSNYSTNSKYYHNSNKLVVGKMKDKTGSVAIEEKMYSFLVDNNNEHIKAKEMNRNLVVTVIDNEYKYYCCIKKV